MFIAIRMRLIVTSIGLFLLFFAISFMEMSAAKAADQPTTTLTQAQKNVIAVVPRHWPPQYLTDETGKPAGFAIDTLEAIAEIAGLSVSYKTVESFPEAIDTLKRGDADLIPNVGILPQRMDISAFTAPLETFQVSIFVRNDTHDISGEVDLIGRKLALVKANIGFFMFGKRTDIDHALYPDAITALFELLAGHVDALVYPQSVLLALARQIGVDERIKIVGQPLKEIKRGIQVRKEAVALLAVLDDAVKSYIRTPAYQQFYNKWYGKQKAYWTTLRVIGLTAGLIFITLFIAAGWHYFTIVRLNRALKESEKRTKLSMEEVRVANHAKTQFLANMSHELRTPLNSVIGFSQILMGQGLGNLDSTKSSEYATLINYSANHLLALIQNILDVSKIEAQELDLEKEPIDFEKLIQDCFSMMQEPAKKGNVQLQDRIAKGAPCIKADELRLKQVLLNLLSNAIKFTINGGQVTVSVEDNQDGGVILTVKDTGIGIEKKDIPKILQPFGQAKDIFSRNHEGTGLGLSLAKSLVELHEGSLRIISHVGKGTTVIVNLPNGQD